MNTLRGFLFAAIVVIYSSTLALGGDIQGPGKSEPPPTSASTTESTAHAMSMPTPTQETQIAWQDVTAKMLLEILLTTY